jgi:3'(2'), 5'-bisphosphate nucleotidase
MADIDELRRIEPGLRQLARKAGSAIMVHYSGGAGDHELKADGTPVTAADEAAEAIILAALPAILPGVPAVSEEEVAEGRAPDISGGRFWLVDPLDGTREFLSRNGEFTVNIALIEAGRPLLGVVHAPALGLTYAGTVGAGALLETAEGPPATIVARTPPAEGLTVVASRSHGDRAALARYLEGRRIATERSIGSSLKFCLIAGGQADLYPRFGRTMEWDTAAGHAVLAAAGGAVETVDGRPLLYGKPGFENPHFVAFARR